MLFTWKEHGELDGTRECDYRLFRLSIARKLEVSTKCGNLAINAETSLSMQKPRYQCANLATKTEDYTWKKHGELDGTRKCDYWLL